MANDKKFVVKNGLQTQNVSFTDSTNTISVSLTGNDALSFSGDAGQLFSVIDDMSGTIFSVNDVSGIPSIEVDADGTVRFAEFEGNVLVGTSVDDGASKLQVSGTINPKIGNYNIGIGEGVFTNLNANCFDNIAIGRNTLVANISDYNIGIGRYSLCKNTTGQENIALGSYGLFNNLSGLNNIAIGESTLLSNSSGSNNIALGYYSAGLMATGSFNIGIGACTLRSATSESHNLALGCGAMRLAAYGASNNVAIGQAAAEKAIRNNNVAIGNGAYRNPEYGEENIAIGLNSMAGTGTTATDKGYGNVAIGSNTLQTGSYGDYNVAIGYRALCSSSGSYNIALGYGSLKNATTAPDNIAIGSNSLDALTVGSSSGGNRNVAVGYGTLSSLVCSANFTAQQNTAVGYMAGYGSTSASYNTFMGQTAGYTTNTGNYNTAIGYAAYYYGTSGSNNVSIGQCASRWTSTGSDNVAIGQCAGAGVDAGSNNVAIGTCSLFTYNASAAKSNNTAIGYKAGWTNTTGANNIFIGYCAIPSSAGASNEITLGNSSIARFRIPGLGHELTLPQETAVSVTATAGDIIYVISSGLTITLPASPTEGNSVKISVGNFTNTTVARNGSTIMGLSENLTIDVAYAGIELVYVGALGGWRII